MAGLAFVAPASFADGWEAELELEISRFPQESPNPQSNYTGSGSVATTLSRSDYWGDAIIDTKLFYREDGHDGNRSHFDIRDLMIILPVADFEFKAGIGGAFWGYAESVHLVDIINQTDSVESLSGEEKLGQPLLSANWYGQWGTVQTYVMPLFRPRVFASEDGRPALPLPFTENEDDYQYESSDREKHVDFALRWSHNFGPLDFALSLFKGTERAPRSVVCFGRGTGRPNTENGPNCDLPSGFQEPNAAEQLLIDAGLVNEDELIAEAIEAAIPDLRLVPHYDQTERIGLELQWNLGDILAKAELLYGEQLDSPYRAAVGGFEYIWSNSLGLPLDVRVISEYLYDDRDTAVYFNLFDNDVFFGARFEFQDTQSTTFLIGTIYDLENHVVLYLAEGTRRLGNASSLSLEAQVFSHFDDAPEGDSVAFFRNADTYTAKLKLYF
jgi:hypothetical protein